MPTNYPYSSEPENKRLYTEAFDAFYTRFATLYDRLVKWLPLWRNWIAPALPALRGPRVLEVSFGTGYLLTQYAHPFDAYGLDYNRRMAEIARRNVVQHRLTARLLVGQVEALPFGSAAFDSVLNTMAFTGYPDAHQALSEMRRVLKPGGRLVMIDINFPADGNWRGMAIAKAWARGGDILRDMDALFQEFGLPYTDRTVGGWGSVRLYVATKPGGTAG
ncbi:MAG TPA: class I SAM-dependent methyltransferase [Chloroflexi bacterium]|nr:class I SAM-dependent methyltransferase [Chloroflexota bacterium]